MDVLFLDTETTGIPAYGQEPLSIAIVNVAGEVLLDTLIRPVRHTQWPEAQHIHGISPEQVLRDEVPTLAELTPRIAELVRGQKLVIYNAAYDTEILADVLAQGPPAEVVCLMLAFAEFYKDWHEYYQNYRWQSLQVAAAYVLHEDDSPAHRALPDTLAARAVWLYLQDEQTRAQVDAERKRQYDLATEEAIVYNFLWGQQDAESRRLQAVNDAWTLGYFPELVRTHTLYIHGHQHSQPFLSAYKSAEAFSVHLTGFGLQMWARYGDQLLLPRYGKGHAPVPEHLVPRGNVERGVYFLSGGWQRPVAAMLVTRQHQVKPGQLGQELSLMPLYDVSGLVEGVEYLRYVRQAPEGYYNQTQLKKQFGLKPAQLEQLRPTLVWHTRYGVNCLLYSAGQVTTLLACA